MKRTTAIFALILAAAMLLAGLAAEGETIIDHAELIDRGYDKLHETLNALGAQIIRKEN